MPFLDYEDRDLRREDAVARRRHLNRVLYYVTNTVMLAGLAVFVAGAFSILERGEGADVLIALGFLAFLAACLALNIYAHRRDKPPGSPH